MCGHSFLGYIKVNGWKWHVDSSGIEWGKIWQRLYPQQEGQCSSKERSGAGTFGTTLLASHSKQGTVGSEPSDRPNFGYSGKCWNVTCLVSCLEAAKHLVWKRYFYRLYTVYDCFPLLVVPTKATDTCTCCFSSNCCCHWNDRNSWPHKQRDMDRSELLPKYCPWSYLNIFHI